jgi:hypothetical protein
MSWVTDVLLLFSLEEVYEVNEAAETCEETESEALTGVNAWLHEQGYGRLVNLGEHASRAGDRAMQAEVYGGAFNFLDVPAFIGCVQEQKWRSPGNVQLLLQEEQERRFTLYELVEGELRRSFSSGS